ncbi:hypothetical protein GCM10022226_59540 [Sphaerisporangium flaviroseum]|uniref:Uncharacterized protein n=1 Tax=Sphaerisporangium flaviroseum TaxID=509199 RepID=A0ABP7IZU9_9ACTN
MAPRINYLGHPVAAKFLKYIVSAGKVVADSTLPAATQQLVAIRASQARRRLPRTNLEARAPRPTSRTSSRPLPPVEPASYGSSLGMTRTISILYLANIS